MPETITHIHSYPDTQIEAVKIEKNSRGFNFEIKAGSIERALEMADQLTAELATREKGE